MDLSDDSNQKRGLETNSGDFSPASARTACAQPLRPFKRNPSKVPQHPFSTPELDYHLVRLGTNPIGSAVYRPLISHLSPARGVCLISLQRDASLLGRTRGINRRGRASEGKPIGPGCPLGLMICLIRMLCHPKSTAAHPKQACIQPDSDTSRQTLGLVEALVQAPNCAS